MLVKVVQEHTLSKARKASGSKSRTDAGRNSNDAGRSKNIDLFAGKPEQLGKQTRDWLSSVEVYLDSVESERPVRVMHKSGGKHKAKLLLALMLLLSNVLMHFWLVL